MLLAHTAALNLFDDWAGASRLVRLDTRDPGHYVGVFQSDDQGPAIYEPMSKLDYPGNMEISCFPEASNRCGEYPGACNP